METLLITLDILSNGYMVGVLDIVSIMSLFAGITILVIKNPIAALISLIGLFASISVYLIYIGLTFIGFSYLIVYIGAVSILFLFILMLINIRNSELLSNNWDSISLGLFITILFNYALLGAFPYFMTVINSYSSKFNAILLNNQELISEQLKKLIQNAEGLSNKEESLNIMYTASSNWDGNMVELSHISAIGNVLYTTYSMWLFIVSYILLLAMVGAIALTISQDKKMISQGN